MKAPWFPFYTGDFLASPDVQLMEAHEVGAYVLLLANSWQSDSPGYLPNEESRLRRVCRLSADQWKESRDLLLSKWPVAENGQRCNPRLLREADTQLARRDRLAANGAKGGRPAQNQKDTKQEPTDNLQLSKNNLQVIEAEPTGLLSQPQPQTTSVVEKTPPAEPLKAKSKAAQLAGKVAAEGTDTFTAETWLGLNDPQQFAIICRSLTGLKLPANLDTEAYRESIKRKVADRNMDVPATTMRNFIESFFMKLPTAELRTIDATLPTVPTPRHELPAPRQERPGQIIAIEGIGYDQTMNRMKIATAQNNWPTAQIHAILPR